MNPYINLCIQVQALRRQIEGIRTPLMSALGVAATVYTHQILNTLRVLTDVRVRHLLADEVGLGKTVQALMVLNALRCWNRNLRALIIVPDRLVPQWRDEVFVRAHTTPIEAGEPDEEAGYIQLAWEDQFRSNRISLSEIDPDRYDVLVVDELHSLTTLLQDRIVRTAPVFNHVLVLTATPAFQDIRRHAELFAILEPERTAIARWRYAKNHEDDSRWKEEENSNWSRSDAECIVQYILDRDLAANVDANDDIREEVALVHCAYRRVIRTRRLDYPGVLPRRRHIPLEVEPLGVEVDRQALMWNYFGYLDTLTRRFDPVSLAKRVVLSPPSLEQRVDFLRRFDHDREGLLERVKPLVHRSQGDSRADALVDLLQKVWVKNPRERVLVAAQDNLTVDYLFDLVLARLPKIGPSGNQCDLTAARVRQGMMVQAVEELGGFGNETNENLEAFQRGEASILFATEFAQVGLNLQCARVLILYSVPWRPDEVEQWIGRLDRIGNAAAYSGLGEAQSIDVYTIVQRGLVDQQVVRVLQSFEVFEHGVNLDGTHLEDVSKVIESAALNQNSVNWEDLEKKTETMAAEDAIQELESPLRGYLPWTPEAARRLKRELDAMSPLRPVINKLSGNQQSGVRSLDRAFEGFIGLLVSAGQYNVRRNVDLSGAKYRSIWYTFANYGIRGRREVQSKVVFDCGANPHEDGRSINALAFISRRGDLSNPPLRRVTLQIERRTANPKLHFLNFGDPIHDQLIAGWLPKKGQAPVQLNVILPVDHEFFQRHSEGIYVGRIGVLDPAGALQPRESTLGALREILAKASTPVPERLAVLARAFERRVICAMEADLRWIRHELPSTMVIVGLRMTQEGWVSVGEEALCLLLNPVAQDSRHVARSYEPSASADETLEFASGVKNCREVDFGSVQAEWGSKLAQFEKHLSVRRAIFRQEQADAREIGEFELIEAQTRLESIRSTGIRPVVAKAESEVIAAGDNLALTDLLWAQRDAWLARAADRIRTIGFREHIVFALRVAREM